MPVLAFLILIVVVAITGSVSLFFLFDRLSSRRIPPLENGNVALLREEVETLAGRLERVEEEVEFYKRLKAPDEPDQ